MLSTGDEGESEGEGGTALGEGLANADEALRELLRRCSAEEVVELLGVRGVLALLSSSPGSTEPLRLLICLSAPQTLTAA